MTKYREEIAQGEAAFETDCPRSDNPHAYLSAEWYAWDAGWGSAQQWASHKDETYRGAFAQYPSYD